MQKVSKSKTLLRAHFWSNYVQTFLDDAKLAKFCAICFYLSKQSNIGYIFWIFLWKIMKGWSENYEIQTTYGSCHVQKTPENKKFSGHPFIVNFTFEIYKYFSLVTWSLLRYLELKLLVTIQLVPNSLADSLISKCKGSRVWLMVQVYSS